MVYAVCVSCDSGIDYRFICGNINGFFVLNMETYPMSIEQLGEERLGAGVMGLIAVLVDDFLIVLLVLAVQKTKKLWRDAR
jgi:hypothetical protein